MRTGALLISLLFLTFTAFAADVGLKTITIDGEKAYVLEAGAFPKESSALQLKLKLSALFKQPLTIDYQKDRKLYVVKMGPLKNLEQAQELQKLLGKDSSSSSTAQTSSTSTQGAVNSTKKLWNLRGADIRAVIAEVSRVTGKNFIIDPRVQGKISIVSSTPMSDKELYQVFLSMLQISGYAAIPSGDVIKIIPNIDAKTVSSDYEYDLRNPPRGDDMLVEVIPVKYVPSEQLVPVLRPLMPQWSSVSAYAPSNMLILSGRASNIRKLAAIIKQVDSSSTNGIDMVPLHYALAMDVVATLKDLMKTQPGSTAHSQTMLAADDRSNAILISGNKTERIRLRLLISQLDRQHPNGSNSNTQVIYLNYLRAEDLVPILAGIAQANFSGNVGTTIGTITRPELDSTNPASNLVSNNSSTNNLTNSSSGNNSLGQGGQSGNAAATPNTSGSTTQNEGTTKPTVQIIAEPNTNSIIVNAPASLIRILKSVITQLDIKPAQLLIEALVAEVDESDINSLGIEWGSDRQTGNPASFSPGFAIINSKTSIDDFQAQIYALARERKANILSTPSVVVLDNRQAKILVGKQVSVASTTYPNNAGGTTTASPYVTFDRVNVALHLYVRPQITRGQGIQLQIDQGNDTLDPSTTLNTDNPTFKISSIVTSVHVESGDIVVLGGLTQDSLANDDNKLPIIGDIPGLGRLFQHNIRNREKRVLMVFIRPIILRNPRDSFSVTGGKYNDLRQYQLDSLRQQESFHQSDDEIVLPALSGAELPKPFNRAIKQVVITPMTTK
ncbi:type II protein secretion LspD [Legionella birminghamensis]|uniref:Type II protein secretion LspD n=1 Tax=Legionella birminghamensis TaxID=28083 RepID=A0A378IGS7_9GAMM|nr:GspD family T2SS secretin variant LspD [Legionella birminghamensis]KTC67897.1 type II protein secretion LspD [Legionella birminghamensis]STX31394.1 type II protein secretion LspD [Legionella birminghamensis]